jgi:subtilisin family serine protease
MHLPTGLRSLLIRLASLFFFLFKRRLVRERSTTMTKDAGLKSKTDRGATGFKFNQNLRTLMIFMGLFVVALIVAPPSSTWVTGRSNTQKIEVFQGRQVVANEVLVRFRDSVTPASIAQVEQDEDIDSNKGVGGIGVRLLHSRSKDVTTLIGELSARSDVAYAEPNYIVHADQIPNDPNFSSLWGLRNTGQFINGIPGTPGADISATSAWDISTGSRANVVAVVDTGIDYTHPDLSANVWSAPTSFTVTIGGQTINCAAGTHGFNAITNTCNPMDDHDHGTHVSGTIGALSNNGAGVAGVNWVASIMGAKFLDAGGFGTTANAINAIEFTIQAKQIFGANANVRVLSNSWGGGGFSQALLDEINKANSNNMLFVAAAGNFGSNNDFIPEYPANYNAPNVVAVAATNNNDQLAFFSNYGRNTVHLGAPGADVLSTTRFNNYSFYSGTSMATPHVSGAAALVLSVCSLETASLKNNLLNNVDPISSLSDRTITGGRLNVNKAIRACLPLLARPTSVETCRLTPATTTITVFGGAGNFQNDVDLTLLSINPQPPPGGEITASFSPNPVPIPSPQGSDSTMTINTTASTPAGSYTLTVQGTDGTVTATSQITLVVRAGAPDAPSLLEPADGVDGVLQTPTFRWSAVPQATRYRLQVCSTSDCSTSPVRDIDNITATQFTLSEAQGLDRFKRYWWRVIASNVCGDTASGIFSFRTLSCSTTPRNVISNGGFEEDLTAWVIDAQIPQPQAVTVQKRSGAKSLRLGTIADSGTQTQSGNSEVHQRVTIPSTAINPMLSFWFYGQSAESFTNDFQEVFIVPISTPGPAVTVMRDLNNSRTFINRTFALDAFKGQTIEIHFRVSQNGNTLPTGMYIDDVSVSFISCGVPDFSLRVMASTFNEVCAGGSIGFTVGVDSLNGQNFISPVRLSATNLPPGATVRFTRNPILPGTSTTMILSTQNPTVSGRHFFSVVGVANDPPPVDPRTIMTYTDISSGVTHPPEQIAPLDGDINVPLRPTLSWTEPFVDSLLVGALQQQRTAAPTNLSAEEMSAYAPSTAPSLAQNGIGIAAFGAARYHVQLASDPDFVNLLLDTDTPDIRLTVPVDLEIATRYYWRVSAANACGESDYSPVQSFVTGACSEGWQIGLPVPVTNGPAQASVVAVAGKIYVFGGGVGPLPDSRINQVWAFDPKTNNWSRKADIPSDGPGATYGSAATIGGKVYLFGGVAGAGSSVIFLRTLWIYDTADDTWSRGRDLPIENFGSAVAAIGHKIYLAYGSGFSFQTWEYDPAADTYTQKATPPFIANPFRVHGEALGDEMHAFAGGFGGTDHVVYNATTNSWRTAPSAPVGVTDPAVAVLGGKFYVVGGRPQALTQIFDPASNTWSQGPLVPGLPNGLDNTEGAALGDRFYLAGGYDGSNGTNAFRSFKVCGPNSAQYVSYATDGAGDGSGSNERTSLTLSNDTSGATTVATVFFNRPDGTVDSSGAFLLQPGEVRVIPDIIRQLRGVDSVQNVEGSLSVFASESIDVLASITNAATNDQTMVDGEATTRGIRSGFVPAIQLNNNFSTQLVIRNASGSYANVQLLAYPARGGGAPVAATSVVVPPHGMLNFSDIAGSLGLPAGHYGQLTWNSTQPVTVFARDVTSDKGFSGASPKHSTSDGTNTLSIAYVEDTAEFSSSLQLNNNGPFTANVTATFVAVDDPTGGTSGTPYSRDIPVAVNSGSPIANVIRWAMRSGSAEPTGRRGFLLISSAQRVTAQVSLVNSVSKDPAWLETKAAVADSSTLLGAANPDSSMPVRSRLVISVPAGPTANVRLMAFNLDGTPAISEQVTIQVVGGGQFFTDDLAGFLGLPPGFLGSLTINSNVPVLGLNLERTDSAGGFVAPIRPR